VIEEMKQFSILNFANQLKKMPVTLPETGEIVGQVRDVIIHPTEGRVLGLILQSARGETCAVTANDFFIFSRDNVVVMLECALSDQPGAWQKMADGISVCQEIIGTSIVTEKGKYIGYVSDVLITEEPLHAVYQVIESLWQKYFGRGFYISADLPHAWSRDGNRFIVREDELMRHRASQPVEVIRVDGQEMTIKEEVQRAGR
jgi:sporulation protein YlmC with PRC-barrel domain